MGHGREHSRRRRHYLLLSAASLKDIDMNKQKFFYGWYVALASGFGIAFSIAVFISSTIGLLAAPLTSEMGWQLKEVFGAPTVAVTVTILVAPFIGAIVDRFGARRVIAFSFIAQALIMASFYLTGPNILWFYARYAALALLATGATAVSFAGVISRWFDRRRGLALGIALAGIGIGGVTWSLMTQWLFDHVGWRASFLYMGAFVACVVLPIVLAVVRESPAAMGLQVDGAAAPVGKAAGAVHGLSLREAARTGQYWLMLVTVFLVGFGVVSAMQHIVPIVKSHGGTAQTAALVQASMWAALVVGRLSTGWLMDRFFAPRVAVAFLLPAVVGILMLGSGAVGLPAFVAAMMIGLASGAEVDVIAYLTGRYFGMRHYSAIYGTYFSLYALGSGWGPTVTAWILERSGDYSRALWIPGIALLVSAVLLLCFRRFGRASGPVTADTGALREA
jgi:OFA family oxalate/formate antiporter-like MFS transporter